MVAYQWTEGATLLGTSPMLSTSLPVGVHTLTLAAIDVEGAVGTDTVVITVLANQGPAADAGPDITLFDTDGNGNETVDLMGIGSDPDGQIATYQWSEGSTVIGNTANLTTVLPVGTHLLTLTVTDNGGAISSDTMLVTISEPPSETPLYVFDIRFESYKGNRYRRAVFEIRSDSNGDGQGNSADAAAAGVSITVEFAGHTYTGTTDANGIFRTSWVRNVSSGTYAEVVDLALADYAWDPLLLDLEDDSDGNGLPDAIV